jgi:hypothetical protein
LFQVAPHLLIECISGSIENEHRNGSNLHNLPEFDVYCADNMSQFWNVSLCLLCCCKTLFAFVVVYALGCCSVKVVVCIIGKQWQESSTR